MANRLFAFLGGASAIALGVALYLSTGATTARAINAQLFTVQPVITDGGCCTAVDGACTASDAYCAPVDAHTTAVDAACDPYDGGCAPVDAHYKTVDAHCVQVDAHCAEVDGACTEKDATNCPTNLAPNEITSPEGYSSLEIFNESSTPIYIVGGAASRADGGYPVYLSAASQQNGHWAANAYQGAVYVTLPARVDGGHPIFVITGR